MRSSILLIGAALAACVATARAGEPIPLGEPKEYPQAGVTLAVPRGAEHPLLTDAFEVVRAVLREPDGKEPAVSVALSAYPVTEKVTAEMFSDAMAAELKNDLTLRGLEVGAKVAMKAAGLDGVARRMRFRVRGVPTEATNLCFLRDEPKLPVRICYVLSVEVSPKQRDALLPLLGAVVGSLKLTRPRHPSELAVEEFQAAMENPRLGFSIRPPAGWYAAHMPQGVHMGMTDYLLGGQPMPSVRLIVDETEGQATAEASAAGAMQLAIDAAREHKLTAKAVSKGPDRLGGREAYQFVLRESAAAGTEAAGAVIVQRCACVPTAGGATRRYSLVLVTRGDDVAAAAAMMDKIAAQFAFVTAPASQPASGPASAPSAK
ncbi:MAG TPA: hypothetical protein DCX07_12970 [Phycisphaerales bacterium]|nr:hypothetical protein [Phycisphaerales bacterium]